MSYCMLSVERGCCVLEVKESEVNWIRVAGGGRGPCSGADVLNPQDGVGAARECSI